MPRWFHLNLDEHRSILLKKAVAAMAQVASTDGDLAGRPQTADLFVKPDHLALVSRTSSSDDVSAVLIDLILLCNQSRKLHINLASLNGELKRNTGAAVTLYGNEDDQNLIRYELQKVHATLYEDAVHFHVVNHEDCFVTQPRICETVSINGFPCDEVWYRAHEHTSQCRCLVRDVDGVPVYSCILPVSSWTDHVVLDPGKFLDVLTQLESFGFKVHAKGSAAQTVFQVVNPKFVIRTKAGRYQIVHSEGHYPYSLEFGLDQKSAFLNAACLSNIVRLHKVIDSCTMLDMPIDGLGSLKFRQLLGGIRSA